MVAPLPLRARNLRQVDKGAPFWGLMFFTFILFVGPQAYFPVLYAFRIALVTAGLTLAIYVGDCLIRGRPLTISDPTVRLLLYFLALAGLGIPFSRWPGGAFDAFFNELLKSLLIFLLVANTVDTLRRMRLMIGSMVLWGIFMSWTAVRDFGAGNLLGGRIYGYDSPLAANPNDLALILNLILALSIGLYLSARKPFFKLCLIIAMGLLVSAIITSFSRGGFMTLATTALVLLIERVRTRGPVVLVWALVLVILALALLPHGYGGRLYSIFDSTADATGSADARWKGMVLAWNVILEHPLLGLGLQMHGLGFLEATGDWNWAGVHNVYLQIGADLGVPALIVYLLAFWKVVRGTRESLKRLTGSSEGRDLRAVGTGIEIALAAFAVGAFFHPVAYHFYFFYVAGLAVAFQQIAGRLLLNGRGEAAAEGLPGHAPRGYPQTRYADVDSGLRHVSPR